MKYQAILITVLSLGFISVADARSQRVQQIPNGVDFTCSACHIAEFPSGPQDADHNVFGLQVKEHLSGSGPISTQEVDWQAIYDLDADGDGYTNGEELGDPEGKWVQDESAPRTYDPSHPGDGSSHQCDNLDLPQSDACSGEGSGDAADAGADAGGSDTSDDLAHSESEISDEGGCTAGGSAAPVSTSGLIVLLALGHAALRRQFSS